MIRKILSCLAVFSSLAMAGKVTVDLNTTHQTIDGMGGFGAMRTWWSGGPFYTADWLNTVIDSLGFTMIRTEFYPRPDDDNAWTRQIPYLKALKAKADASGETIRVIATVWTPPASMKTTANLGTGELIRTKAGEYADYLITYIKDFKTQCGYDLYAISPGNEVQVTHGWFNSCKWDAAFLGDFCIMLAKKIAQENLPTKIYFGDDLYGHFSYAKTVDDRIYTQHDATKDIVRAAAMHYGANGSTDGVFKSYGALTASRGRVAWNSEFGNGPNTWGDAWGKAKDIHMMLRNNYGAIVYWLIGPHTNSSQMEESVMPNDRPGPKAYTAKAFFRFIRPGAVRVGSTCTDANLWTVAFKHPETGRITVILLNNGSSTITATVEENGLSGQQFDMYQTGEGSNCVKTGTVNAGSSISVPSRNIVSLYSQATTSIHNPASSARTAFHVQNSSKPAVLIGLDGRTRGAIIPGTARLSGVFFAIVGEGERRRSMKRVVRLAD